MTARRSRRRGPSKAEREFVAEAEEILERMREDLAELAEGAGGEPPPERVNGLFRSAHSLKGLAGLFGLESIRELAHRLEDLLDGLRMGRVALDVPALARLDRAVKLFAELLRCVGDASALAGLAEPVASLARELAGARAPAPAAPSAFAGLALDPALLAALTEYEEHRLRESLRAGRFLHLVEATFELASFDEGLGELTRALRELGEVLSTLPAPSEGSLAQLRFSLLFASELDAERVAAALEMPEVALRTLASGRRAAAPGAAPAAPALPAAAGESLKSLSDTVRVDIRKLDELMNLVAELAAGRDALGALAARLGAASATARDGAQLARLHRDFERRLRELQAAVLEVRMVPLRQVFEKVARIVRRLRAELGKDVRLDLLGADTELDKLIVEELVDPLMHAVRNALDHGIEPPEERRAAGKPAQGRIRIEAFQRGRHVVIEVSDDGRGIDRAALRAAAEACGLVQPEEALSERETLALVFAPGLSTRGRVTATSGRGVGMDVVHANVARLGGAVDVESTPGRGTTLSLTLPITLALIQSLVVGAGGQRFAVPLGAVRETLLVDPSQVVRSEGRELLDLRGEPILLRRLAAEFGLPAAPADAKAFAVVLGIGEACLGLLVDRLEGQQDAVVKPIQGPCAAARGIAGASELGGREPVLVLDASALLADALARREAV